MGGQNIFILTNIASQVKLNVACFVILSVSEGSHVLLIALIKNIIVNKELVCYNPFNVGGEAMVTADTFKRGFKNGISALIDLSKMLVPVYIAVQLLSVSGLLNIISEVFRPVMSFIGLPGEASLIIILGYFLGTYAALGAIAAIELTGIQITTIAVMLSISHALITESAIIKKLGVSAAASVAVRVSFSILMGFLYYRIFG